MSPPVLTIPHPNRRFVVDVNACADQLGCALLQKQEDGDLRHVGYYSRTLKPAEKNYCATERECFALVWGVISLRQCSDDNVFTGPTDHQALDESTPPPTRVVN